MVSIPRPAMPAASIRPSDPLIVKIILGWTGFKKKYPLIYWLGVIGLPAVLAFVGITLNLEGHRFWNLLLGAGLGAVFGYYLLKPGVLQLLAGAGVGKELLDGEPDTWVEVITGGVPLIKVYLRIGVQMLLAFSTFFLVLSAWPIGVGYEGAAYATSYAALIFFIGFFALVPSTKLFTRVVLTIWGTAMFGGMAIIFLTDNYFDDGVRRQLVEAEVQGEVSRRAEVSEPILKKLEAGETLTPAEQVAYQRVQNQNANNGILDALSPTCPQKTVRWNEQPSQTITLDCTAGRYTFTATSEANSDAATNIGTVAYLNGAPPTGRHPINIGPNGQVSLTIRLNPADVEREAQWARDIAFTFSPE